MKKLVFVGTGIRCHWMFTEPIFKELKKEAKICGLYDINKKRAEVLAKYSGNPDVYSDFNVMLDTVKPDYVVVTTSDVLHDKYIIEALHKGYDVITEKPMTIDELRCNAILQAEKESGKKVYVTFNCRFMPLYSEIKKLLNSGIVGKVTHIDFQYMLDLVHGTDYFRRWHSRMENSGSLLCHKSTHHFDIINWFLNDIPEEVSAFGTQNVYGSCGTFRGVRCLTCEHKSTCNYYLDLNADPILKELYLDTESEDGYIRDKCIFHKDVDIYDTMSVQVKYTKDAFLQYALTTYSPYEGLRMIINGTNGRLEAEENGFSKDYDTITHYDLNGRITKYQVPKGRGAHNGGDAILRQALFGTGYKDDLKRMADSLDGAYSLLIGAAANHSIKEKKNITISNLMK